MTVTAPPNAPNKLIDTNTAQPAAGSQSASKDGPAK